MGDMTIDRPTSSTDSSTSGRWGYDVDRPTDDVRADRPTDFMPSTADSESMKTEPAPVESTTDSSTDDTNEVDDREPWALRVGLSIALWVLSTTASVMTSVGQVGFARWAHVSGPIVYGVPVIFDMFDVVLLLLGYRQGRRKRSPYPLWALAAVIAGFSFYTNVIHADDRAGLVYGGASIVTFVSWLVKLRIDLTKYLEKIRAIPPGRPKFGKLGLVAPRVRLHTFTISVRRRVTDGDLVVLCAETWIMVHDDTYAALRKLDTMRRSEARRLAKRTAWATVFTMTGGPAITVPEFATVETVAVNVRSTDSDPVDDVLIVDDRPAVDDVIDRPTIDEPSTDLIAVDRPTEPEPSTDAKSSTGLKPPTGSIAQPTDSLTADEPPTRPAIEQSTTDRPRRRATARRSTTEDRALKPTDFTNAELLVTYFPGGLPDEPYDLPEVRSVTVWSYDRAKYAIKAYRSSRGDSDDSEPELAAARSN